MAPYSWFGGHLTLLLCVLRYGLSYITFNYYSRWAQVTYRLAFVSAAATYGIVVYKAYRARLRAGATQQGALMLASDENVQYLRTDSHPSPCGCTADLFSSHGSCLGRSLVPVEAQLLWLTALELYSRQVPLALLPFAVYSIFHVATYTRTNIIPTLQPPKAAPAAASATSPTSPRPAASSSPLANSIQRFVKEYYDASMTLVAGLEILLWFRLLLSAFTFSKASWVLLGAYTIFLRARLAQSQFVQTTFSHIAATIDGQVQNQSVPPAIRQGWESFKGVSRKAVEATDMRRYVNGPPAQGMKKPQ